MTTNDIPRSIWQGTFHVLGVDVECYTLSDGQRIIDADSMEKLLDAMMTTECKTNITDDMKAFAKWQRGETMDDAAQRCE
jgi:hypothetical protein